MTQNDLVLSPSAMVQVSNLKGFPPHGIGFGRKGKKSKKLRRKKIEEQKHGKLETERKKRSGIRVQNRKGILEPEKKK